MRTGGCAGDEADGTTAAPELPFALGAAFCVCPGRTIESGAGTGRVVRYVYEPMPCS